MALHDVIQPRVATIEHDGKTLEITCRVAFDGIEYVGRLWFANDDSGEGAIPDRGAFPGRSREEVIALAERLTPAEFALRYRRALAERRRFHELRRATEDILSKVRYLNQVVVSMQAGLLDEAGAAQEIEITHNQLHELIERLRDAAGVEGAR